MQRRRSQPYSIHRSDVRDYDAIIVGAGFSGLYQLHKLRDELGLSARVLEVAGGAGGTWYWNRYPGARCNSESYYYSYSFSSALEQEWNWTERYADHAEIRRYLEHVAERFDLLRDIQFDTRVVGARFQEVARRWSVQTDRGEQFTAQFLVTAVGCLSSANVPDIPGLNSFRGRWYHTARWPHNGVDFAGKRVGLIGTGSRDQVAPVIAEVAAHLTVFQRTPNYSIPARNAPMTENQRRRIKDKYKEICQKSRGSTNGHPFDISDQSALEVSPEERIARFEGAWELGGLRFRAVFKDLLFDKAANDTASDFVRAKIRQTVKDPEVAERLMPVDHPFATKRPPIDTNYFEMSDRANVELVDIRCNPINTMTPDGISTKDGNYPFDIIVLATGFDAMTGPLLAMNLLGRGGRGFKDAWAAVPHTYLGLQVAGFPTCSRSRGLAVLRFSQHVDLHRAAC